jgi:hypothetical protein
MQYRLASMRTPCCLASTLLAVMVLAGCGGGTRDQAVGTVLTITIDGDRVAPVAQQLEASAGEPIGIRIRSDRPGELHVHSAPEQTVEFEAGTMTEDVVVETPGVVYIEEHASGVMIAEVRVR